MDTQQVIDIAKLYYQQNLGQDDIARLLDISRSTVSRALKAARDRGMVRITIVNPSPRAVELETWLRTTFSLEHVTIVAAVGDPASDLDAVAQAAASYLDHVVPSRGALGVAAGRTAFAVSQQVRPASRPGLWVVPVMGGWVSASSISANEVVRTVAARWGAQSESLFAPAFVSDGQAREALLREEGIRRPLEIARQADVVCVSAASMMPLSTEWRAHHTSISDEDARFLTNLGAVGETCAQFMTEDGTPLDQWNLEKTIALSVAEFRAVPKVVMVASGVEKARALLACCRAGFFEVLMVTEDLAREMESLAKATPAGATALVQASGGNGHLADPV
jgi:DNA-binding transcriptional regulator LsrR (DeoR family)